MPSVSGAQHRLFELIAHNPQAAAEQHISQSVGRDFIEADKGRRFPEKRNRLMDEPAVAPKRKRKNRLVDG